VRTRFSVLVRKCILPIHDLKVPKGCSTWPTRPANGGETNDSFSRHWGPAIGQRLATHDDTTEPANLAVFAPDPAVNAGEGSYKKSRDQPHTLEPNRSRAIELTPNLSADYLTAETTVVTPANN
jgi:hypothetical protein